LSGGNYGKNYKAQCKAHICPGLGAVRLADLTPPMIQKFYNDLGRGDGEKEELSPKSIRNVHGILTKALSTVVKVGYLRLNPASLVTLPRVTKNEIKPLTDQQIKDFLKIADTDRYGAMFKLILFTGLPEGEAIGLTWDCVDFKTGTILINKQLQKRPLANDGFVFASLKNDKARTLTPAPFVMELLAAQRKEDGLQRFYAGEA